MTFSIAEKVNVVEVPAGAPAEFRPEHDTDTMVLDGQEFGMAKAVDWVRGANEHARRARLRAPLITVIANEDELSEHEYRLATKGLSELGGIFFEYPEDCSTFEEAFKSYAEGMARTYHRCAPSRRRRA